MFHWTYKHCIHDKTFNTSPETYFIILSLPQRWTPVSICLLYLKVKGCTQWPQGSTHLLHLILYSPGVMSLLEESGMTRHWYSAASSSLCSTTSDICATSLFLSWGTCSDYITTNSVHYGSSSRCAAILHLNLMVFISTFGVSRFWKMANMFCCSVCPCTLTDWLVVGTQTIN